MTEVFTDRPGVPTCFAGTDAFSDTLADGDADKLGVSVSRPAAAWPAVTATE